MTITFDQAGVSRGGQEFIICPNTIYQNCFTSPLPLNDLIKCSGISTYYFSYKISLPTTQNTVTLFFTTNTGNGWSVRDLNIYRLPCDTSCKSCSGALPTDCLSCWDLAVLNNGICTCVEYHYYEELCNVPIPCAAPPYSSCRRCHFSCKSCSGPSESDCLSCFFLDVLKNG